MKATVPRVKPNFRHLLQERPGWYMSRADYVPERSEYILKHGKRYRVWETAGWDEDRRWLYTKDGETWIWCGDGIAPDKSQGWDAELYPEKYHDELVQTDSGIWVTQRMGNSDTDERTKRFPWETGRGGCFPEHPYSE